MLREDVLGACKEIYCWEDREGIDGRNSFSRRKCFEELLSNTCNGPSWKPISNTYSSLHDNFRKLIELWGNDILLVTPDKIKDKLTEVRSKVRKNAQISKNILINLNFLVCFCY